MCCNLRDGDGFISAAELRDAMAEMGQVLNSAESQALLREADTDGEGGSQYALSCPPLPSDPLHALPGRPPSTPAQAPPTALPASPPQIIDAGDGKLSFEEFAKFIAPEE